MIHKAGLVTKAQAFLTWEPLLFILRAMLFPIILPPTLLYLLNYEMTWCVFVLCRLPSWGVLEGTGVSPILLSSRSLAYLMSWGFWCSCAWSCEKVVLRKEAANITMARLLDVVQLLFSGGKKNNSFFFSGCGSALWSYTWKVLYDHYLVQHGVQSLGIQRQVVHLCCRAQS